LIGVHSGNSGNLEEGHRTLMGWGTGGNRKGFLEGVVAELSLEQEEDIARQRMVGKGEMRYSRQRECALR